MSIVILANPSSGRGRGRSAAAAIAAALGAGARVVETRPGGRHSDRSYLDEALAGATGCVVVGGDGTVHSALPALIASGVPVYHAGLGTENLFSREFGMTPYPARIVAAVRAGRSLQVDVGRIVGPPECAFPGYFALMSSLGPDAGVTRRLAATRRGRITHFSYLGPVGAELADPYLPRLSVWADGRPVVGDRRGWLIVCNSRQYGFRADPGLHASVTDGALDVVFFPAESGMEALTWILASRTRRHVESSEAVYTTGRRVKVVCDGLVMQADGDFLWEAPGENCVEFECVPRALTVLLPV